MLTSKKHLQTGVIAAAAVLLSMLFPLTAVAAPAIPHGDPVVLGPFPAGELCTFPVLISLTDGTKSHDGPGVIAFTGPLVATITNLNTDTAKTFNISGPTQRDGTLLGPALILQPASSNVGPPFLILNNGRVEFNPNGTIATRTGTMTDLCAVLA